MDVGPADADGTDPGERTTAVVKFPSVVRGTNAVQVVTGFGFVAGETVTATVNSTPIVLPVQAADSNGDVTFSFPIGANFELGAHHVDFVGSVSGAIPAEREFTDFVVLGQPAVLASTGFTGAWLAGLATLLLLAGAGAVGVTRRKDMRVN